MNQTHFDDPMIPVPIPEQVAANEGMADLSGTRLGYWDTGGGGEPIVLLHPASGSALVWLYQQPVFAKAGYRVIAYSRRNYYNSDLAPENDPGAASADLQHLVEFLRLDKFHLVGSAAGGSVAADYALSHPERLLSLTVSSNNLAATSPTLPQRSEPRNGTICRVGFASSGRRIAAPTLRALQNGPSSTTSPRPERAPGKNWSTSLLRRSWGR
jgi:pimeloyl-ACP methyl ester carboxylesterase